MPSPNNPDPASPASPVSLADGLGIILIAVPLAILLLTLAAQLAGSDVFSKLPDFVTSSGSKIFTWATGATGVITLLLRSKGRDIWRDFLRWILVVSASCIVTVLLIAIAIPKVTPKAPQSQPQSPAAFFLRLHFALAKDVQKTPAPAAAPNEPIRFRFDQLEPINLTGFGQGFVVSPDTGAVDPSDVRVDLPPPGKRFLAHVVRKITGSDANATPQVPWDLCFMPKNKAPEQHAQLFASLNCRESIGCQIAPEGDPGWIDVCPAPSASLSRFFVVNAAETNQLPTARNWNVPSLQTLKELAPERRTGYTEFHIQSATLPNVSAANTLLYSISVNGASVLIDGLPDWSVPLPFDPKKGLSFDFGLENLSFSGADGGCEHIDVALRFQKDKSEIATVKLSRLYAALRDPIGVQRQTPGGAVFNWGGKYVKPATEGKAEILAGATVNVALARRWKARLDNAGLMYQSARIVGVIRPPLRQPERFGIAVGLLQPSGQIRFTFSDEEALKFVKYLESVRSKVPAALPSAPYFLQPPAPTTGKLTYCESQAI